MIYMKNDNSDDNDVLNYDGDDDKFVGINEYSDENDAYFDDDL